MRHFKLFHQSSSREVCRRAPPTLDKKSPKEVSWWLQTSLGQEGINKTLFNLAIKSIHKAPFIGISD